MFSYSLAILIFLYNCSQSFWAFTTYQIFIQGQTLISISIVIIFTVHFLSYCSKHTPMNVFHSFYCRTCRVSRWRPLLSTLICRWGGQCRAPLEPRAAIMSVGDNAFAAWAPALSCRGQDEHSVLTLSSACLEGLQLLERQCPFMRIPPAKRELVNKLWSVITKKSTRFPPRPPAPFWEGPLSAYLPLLGTRAVSVCSTVCFLWASAFGASLLRLVPHSATTYAGVGEAEGLLLPFCVPLRHVASDKEPCVFQSCLVSESLQMPLKFPDPHFNLDFCFCTNR